MRIVALFAAAGVAVALTGNPAAAAVLNTNYTNVTGQAFGLQAENTYAVVTSSSQYRGDLAWGDYYGPNNSSFYIFNGNTSDSPYLNVDSWTQNLSGGTTYSFSYLTVDNYSNNAVLQLQVNGVLVGNSVDLGNDYGTAYVGVIGPWKLNTWSFTATSDLTGAAVSLVDTNIAAGGNDFSVAAVPEVSTWVMMLAGFAGLGFAGYRRNKSASVAA
jgi:hypothetical protein